MAVSKTIEANGSKGHHKFILEVNETLTDASIAENTSYLSFTFKILPTTNGYDWSGWGDRISYSITIGDNIYTGTIPSYNGTSTVTLKTASNIAVVHNTDGSKTINIAFSVSDNTGQSYTCGNASNSSTMTLTVLHKAPTLTLTNLTEMNSNISATLFVRWVSKKTFTVSYSFYDNATASALKIYTKSGVEIRSSTTLNASSGTIYISSFDIKESDVTNGKTNYILEITDSLGGKTRINTPVYSVTLYDNPNIETSASFVKRNGQTTKEAKITLVGTWFNGMVGSQQNSLTIQYDYWIAGQTEPDYGNYRYSIPMSANTGSGNNLRISDWILKNGNTVLKAFEKENSYYIGILVSDGQTGLVRPYKFLLAKGVWLMAKYKDHVDFMDITIDKNPIVETGSNSDGSWIKYYDGTMKCNKVVSGNTGSAFTLWAGNIYYFEIDNGDWPQEFTTFTLMQATSHKTQHWLCTRDANTTSAGTTRLLRPDNASSSSGLRDYEIFLTAYGRWK